MVLFLFNEILTKTESWKKRRVSIEDLGFLVLCWIRKGNFIIYFQEKFWYLTCIQCYQNKRNLGIMRKI